MRSLSFLAGIVFLITACNQPESGPSKKVHHPSHKYAHVVVDTSQLKHKQTDYLPIYSAIYYNDGTQQFLLTSTASLRNCSLTDTVYLMSACYNDSYGNLLKTYIDSTVMLLPLESIEYVVEETEKEGGAGAHFIIEWGANRDKAQLLIQGIMISTNFQQGISFVTESKAIRKQTH